MHIRVLIFGRLAQTMGTRHLRVDISEPATIGAINEALAHLHPESADWFRAARLAINGSFADRAHPVAPHDEIALIELVSGG